MDVKAPSRLEKGIFLELDQFLREMDYFLTHPTLHHGGASLENDLIFTDHYKKGLEPFSAAFHKQNV